jgi:hypothetical protein
MSATLTLECHMSIPLYLLLLHAVNKSAYVASKHGIFGFTKVKKFLINPHTMHLFDSILGYSPRNCRHGRDLQCPQSWLGADAAG